MKPNKHEIEVIEEVFIRDEYDDRLDEINPFYHAELLAESNIL
jgi:hypothetical protein